MSSSTRDPELTQILVQELERHFKTLEQLGSVQDDPQTAETARRTVHALKGSAGLAGEPELASAMQRLERRFREGDEGALTETIEVVRRAIERLVAGEKATGAEWPYPPADLVAGTLDPLVRTQYLAEVTDRLAFIDDALAVTRDLEGAVAEVYRHIHTLKGASSAVGDEPMAWFCHGLEERIRLCRKALEGKEDLEATKQILSEVSGWRGLLATLVEDPDAALATLRGVPLKRPTQRPEARSEEERSIDGTIRVAAKDIDRLLDHASGIAVARERVAARVSGAMDHARKLRRLRTDLSEALRLIGPPRPWGAPAAALRRIERATHSLAQIGDELDAAAERLEASDQSLKTDAVAAKKILGAMRQTPIRGMFARVAAGAYAEARRAGRLINVKTLGGDELVDRQLVEALADPCLQLARNAIAHGIEPPEVRESMGKSREATLSFSAIRQGNRLSIGIVDDGAGVDVSAVRARAVETGVVTEVLAEAADDQTLLELLFLPGFSTRGQSPDLLAGRGIGLDITLASVQRIGGTIRLSSRHGLGVEARIDVPIEAGLVNVLWVTAEKTLLAIPSAYAKQVRQVSDERIPHLAACLDPHVTDRPAYVLDLDGVDTAGAFSVGVDEVGTTEEVLVRQLSPLLWGIGPYAGAIVRGDGSIRLALDVHALAPRARALGRVPEGRISEPPSRPPPRRL